MFFYDYRIAFLLVTNTREHGNKQKSKYKLIQKFIFRYFKKKKSVIN